MRLKSTFPASAVDYTGYVAPNHMMRAINEGVGAANFNDGVGFSHLFPTIGVTWMLGQCVIENEKFVPCAEEVEVECGGHEQFGVTTVRRCVMYHNGEVAMRFAAKLLPVYFHERKVVPPSVLIPFWKTPHAPCGEAISFIVPPRQMETVEEYHVHYRDCDSNKHMTAFRYLDLVMETAGHWHGELHLPKRVQIDYLKECLPGDVVYLKHAMKDGLHYCSGVKFDGSVSFHATVRFSDETYPDAKITHV
ncbi:MAG: hypothetical protein IJE08_05730 [Clostridia bacterium]|nr:hypothetical protein [Clostridia bacterium]